MDISNGLVLDVDFRGYRPRDKSVYGNILTNFGSIWTPNGRVFDGVDDYINAGNDASLNTTQNFTYSVWVKNSVIAFSMILSKSSSALGGGNGTQLFYRSTSPYLRFLVGDGITIFSVSSSTFVPDVNFHNIIVTRDNTILKLYIDGIQESLADNPVSMLAINDNMNIGRTTATGANYFKGSIGLVRVWNRALTTMEINQLYLEFRKNLKI